MCAEAQSFFTHLLIQWFLFSSYFAQALNPPKPLRCKVFEVASFGAAGVVGMSLSDAELRRLMGWSCATAMTSKRMLGAVGGPRCIEVRQPELKNQTGFYQDNISGSAFLLILF